MMKISLINCTTRNKSRTNAIKDRFIEGLKQNPEVSIREHIIRNWKIKNCKGCLDCWFKKPGVCKIKDDFSYNIPEISKSNIIVFTSPIWVGSGTHLLKIFIERLVSTLSPDFVKHKSGYGHNRINSDIETKTLLISTCALPGINNFESIVTHIKSLDRLCSFKYSGEILKHQSLEINMIDREKMKDLELNCYNAGLHFIGNKIKFDLFSQKISEPYINTDDYIKLCNEHLEKQIK